MVEAVNKVGHVMGITTIAECVETPETLSILEEIGVDYAQGFAIAYPQPYIAPHRFDAAGATNDAGAKLEQKLTRLAGALDATK
jgi:EAL domain-containing protein (putative c-di-GMP-specific phosphodiesterase class I)